MQARRQGSAHQRTDRRNRRDDLAADRCAAQDHREKVEKLQKGDELPPGVIKLVKVYIAMKRKL